MVQQEDEKASRPSPPPRPAKIFERYRNLMDFIPRSGRAAVIPICKGSFERATGLGVHTCDGPGSPRLDYVIHDSKVLKR